MVTQKKQFWWPAEKTPPENKKNFRSTIKMKETMENFPQKNPKFLVTGRMQLSTTPPKKNSKTDRKRSSQIAKKFKRRRFLKKNFLKKFSSTRRI